MNIFKKLMKNEDNKIKNIAIFLTLAFFFMLLMSFLNIKQEIKEKVEQNRELTLKSLEFTIALWIEEQVSSIENAVIYLSNNNIYKNEQRLVKFNHNFLKINKQFDAVQVMLPSRYFYVNEEKIYDYAKNIVYGNARAIKDSFTNEWFLDTKKQLKTTIHEKKKHKILKEKTINLCTPVLDKTEFEGVFCGILKTKSLFDKISKVQIPKNFFYFIVDELGNPLTDIKSKSLRVEIAKTCINSKEKATLYSNNEVINLSKLKRFEWYLGVGVNKNEFLKENMKKTFLHSSLLFVEFVVFVIILNFIYEIIIRKSKKSKEEFEQMLAHKSRLKEIGGLISGVNHQLKQPINSLSLIISNTYEFARNNNLEKDILLENLLLCKEQIWLMDQTIEIYRNFYKYDESIKKFCLVKCIKNINLITKTELSHHNITIKFNYEKSFEVVSIENFIYQILLVLIQNAKDAINLTNNPKNRQIYINLYQKEENAIIEVCDFAQGIDINTQKTIFSEFKKSSKKQGFGLGLYFAKKLAKEKLKGDLMLINAKNPTKFELCFKKNIRL